MIRSLISRRAAVLGLGWWLALGVASEARAQHSADPYKPYNADYDQYLYPSYPNGSGVSPNQALLEMPSPRSTGRSFQSYLDDEPFDSESRGYGAPSTARRSLGVPYYRAYRQMDRAYKRVYVPNEDSDRGYEAARRARDEKYSDYLATPDPAERAKLRKEYEQLDRKTQRDLGEGGRGIARKPAAPATPPLPDLPPVTAPTRGADHRACRSPCRPRRPGPPPAPTRNRPTRAGAPPRP